MFKPATQVAFLAATLALSGCAAMQTAISHHSLKSQTKMSKTIFLDPVANKDKTVFVQVKNTTDQSIALKKNLIGDLENNGWKVVSDFGAAHSMLQVNVLQAGKANSPQSVLSSLGSGFGGALAGGLAGLAISNNATGAAIGAASGGLISWAADALVKDETYSVITDVQVSVKAPKGTKVSQTQQADLSQGSSTNLKQSFSTNSNWLRYRTRIVSYADQVNLKFKEAEPLISKNIAKEVAGILS